MEIEHSIIFALSEPRIYSKLFIEARAIRKGDGETLSKDAFNDALKRLYADEIVKKKNINNREVLYSLDFEKSSTAKKVINVIQKTNAQITKLEKFSKIIERKANEIDEGMQEMKKMGLEDILQQDEKHNFIVREYQKLIMSLIRYILSMQKMTFFYTSKIWRLGFTKKDQLKHQKKYSDIIDRLINSMQKLDNQYAAAIHTIIRKELSQEMIDRLIDEKKAKKLVNSPEDLYYESLS